VRDPDLLREQQRGGEDDARQQQAQGRRVQGVPDPSMRCNVAARSIR
jgi:hypothetical protein